MKSAAWRVAERLLLTLWVGGLWTVGYLAVPVLFSQLDDPALAGALAATMFTAIAWLGLLAGSALLLGNLVSAGGLNNWRAWLLVLMLVLVAVGQFLLFPMILEARDAGAEAAVRFARLHQTAASLYMCNCLLGLVLVIAGTRGGENPTG